MEYRPSIHLGKFYDTPYSDDYRVLSFVGISKDRNLKREYSNPLDVSNRVDIYSTELLTNLQEEKRQMVEAMLLNIM